MAIFHIRFHLKSYRTIFFIFRFIKSDDIEELLGFDDVIKPDPDSEQLNEEVVEYQDTGDFMDPDSEQLNEEVNITVKA
jgi:hypothetical protein